MSKKENEKIRVSFEIDKTAESLFKLLRTTDATSETIHQFAKNLVYDELEYTPEKGEVARIRKPISQVDGKGELIQHFTSIADASQKLGIPSSGVCYHLRKEDKTKGKYILMYRYQFDRRIKQGKELRSNQVEDYKI